jgi:APA family basic amino acid/polyamine antiporter
MQIVIVIVVVFAGVFEVDVSNWSPFMPNGFKSVVTGATVVFFAYVGFDAVANSAEEAKKPQVISVTTHICCVHLTLWGWK